MTRILAWVGLVLAVILFIATMVATFQESQWVLPLLAGLMLVAIGNWWLAHRRRSS